MSPALIGAGAALLAYVVMTWRNIGEDPDWVSCDWRWRPLLAALTGAGAALIVAGLT